MQTYWALWQTSVGLLSNIMSPLLPTTVSWFPDGALLHFQPLTALGVDSHWLKPIRILIPLGLSDWLRNEWLIPSELMKLEGTFAEVSEKEKRKEESSHPLKFPNDSLPAELGWEGCSSERHRQPSWGHKGRPCLSTELTPREQRWEVGRIPVSDTEPQITPCHESFNSVTQFPLSFWQVFVSLFFCYFLHNQLSCIRAFAWHQRDERDLCFILKILV